MFSWQFAFCLLKTINWAPGCRLKWLRPWDLTHVTGQGWPRHQGSLEMILFKIYTLAAFAIFSRCLVHLGTSWPQKCLGELGDCTRLRHYGICRQSPMSGSKKKRRSCIAQRIMNPLMAPIGLQLGPPEGTKQITESKCRGGRRKAWTFRLHLWQSAWEYLRDLRQCLLEAHPVWSSDFEKIHIESVKMDQNGRYRDTQIGIVGMPKSDP